MKNGDNIDIHYSEYWDVANVFNAKKQDGADTTIKSTDYLEEVFNDENRVSMGKDLFIDQDAQGYCAVIDDKNPYNLQKSWIGIYDQLTGITKYETLSPKSFYEPLYFSENGENKWILTLKDADGNILYDRITYNDKTVYPGSFDLGKGLLKVVNKDNIPNFAERNDFESNFEIIQCAKQQMYRFYTTRTLPTYRTVTGSSGVEVGIVYKDVSEAIKWLDKLTSYFYFDVSNNKINLNLEGSLKIDELKATYNKMKELETIHNAGDFSLEIFYSKLTETLEYYKELEGLAPHIELYAQTFEGEIKADPLYFIHHITMATEDISYELMGGNHYISNFQDKRYVMNDFDGYYLNQQEKLGPSFKSSALNYRSFGIEMVDHIFLRSRSSHRFTEKYTRRNNMGNGVIENVGKYSTSHTKELKNFVSRIKDLTNYGIIGAVSKNSNHFENILIKMLLESEALPRDYDFQVLEGDKSTLSLVMDDCESKLVSLIVDNPVLKCLYENRMISITKHHTQENKIMKITWINQRNLEELSRYYFTMSNLYAHSTEGYPFIETRLLYHYEKILNEKSHDFYLKLERILEPDKIKAISDSINVIKKSLGHTKKNVNRRMILQGTFDVTSLFANLKLLAIMDLLYKSSYSINEMIADSKQDIRISHITTREWGPTSTYNTFVGIDFLYEGISEGGYRNDHWDVQLFQNDYNNGNGETSYLTNNFDIIFNSRPLILSSVFEMEPKNPSSLTILENFLIEAINEKQLSNKIDGIYEKEARKLALEDGKQRYNLKDYRPDNLSWFRQLYEKWIRLFAGEYM